MLSKISKTAGMVFAVVFLMATLSFAQEMEGTMADHEGMDMKKMDHSKSMDSMNHEMAKEKSPLVREGEIDLEAIDENKDGKVYQDVMDANVISDKPDTCPLCGMKLKKVTLEKAKKALIKGGFKVK